MKKISLRQELCNARAEGKAIGAFNLFNYLSARAVVRAAEEMSTAVILQTSVGTVEYYGVRELYEMLRGLMEHASVNVYLHLDHCTDTALAKACVDAGWDSVMIDASMLSMEENIEVTREIVEYAHEKHVDVEGELGAIAGVEENISAEQGSTVSFEDCMLYVERSGVDIFAPALGTAHGIYRGTPVIHYALNEQLGRYLKQPVVCHGGSGLTAEVFQRLIQGGLSKINISTALKHAYMDGLRQYLEDNSGKYAPLKLDDFAFERIRAAVKEHMAIFGAKADGKEGAHVPM